LAHGKPFGATASDEVRSSVLHGGTRLREMRACAGDARIHEIAKATYCMRKGSLRRFADGTIRRARLVPV